jgi:hypothetical protein
MRSIRWLLLLYGIVCLQDTAFADSCSVAATQGPYTLNLCLGSVQSSHLSSVVENGPLGTETFQLTNFLLGWTDLSLALNDHGQWALVTDGGTADPGTLYGQYTGPITAPPVTITNGREDCRSGGILPGGTLVGNDGTLGYDVAQSIGFGGDRSACVASPTITGINDQGQVSATVAYGPLRPGI